MDYLLSVLVIIVIYLVPEQLKQVLEQLHDRAGKSGEPETVIDEEVEKKKGSQR